MGRLESMGCHGREPLVYGGQTVPRLPRTAREFVTAGILPLLVLILLLTACGGGGGVNFTASDFSYKVDRNSAPAGKVHFTLNNSSTTYQHELWIYPSNQPKIQDLIAAKDAGKDVSEQEYLHDVAGKIEDLAPGKSAGFDADLTSATYEYACFITSNISGKNQVHYELGMHGTFSVP